MARNEQTIFRVEILGGPGEDKEFTDQVEATDYKYELIEKGVRSRIVRIIWCCHQQVELTEFTNACSICGSLYNQSGQSLRPMEEWEEPMEED